MDEPESRRGKILLRYAGANAATELSFGGGAANAQETN
jgi:hypothetical protein